MTKLACVLAAHELGSLPTDLILFPEGVAAAEIIEAQRAYPNSVIVGATVECGKSRGVVLHRGCNRVSYIKVEGDGRTPGSGNLSQMPVVECLDFCLGLLICMDVDHVAFSTGVINRIKQSAAKLKLLCIPADMASFWFSSDSLNQPRFDGIHVALCNSTKTHQVRCKSFVTDDHGRKIAIQRDTEPIRVELK
jgi:hypothetical protein